MNDPVSALEAILKRNGNDLDLRDSDKEDQRCFLFDRISEQHDLDLAWSLFPAHREVRTRAAEIDAVSDIVAGWGYRIPRRANRCSDAELVAMVQQHCTALCPLVSKSWGDIRTFIEYGFDIRIVGSETGEPPDAMQNILFGALYESMGDFKIRHLPYGEPILEVLKDWAIWLTKCDEVALYLLWPIFKNVEDIDPRTPVPGFQLWQYQCRTNYWIKENDVKSGVVYVQRPWGDDVGRIKP